MSNNNQENESSDEGRGAVPRRDDPSTRMPQGRSEASPEIAGEVINDPRDERMLMFTGLRDQALRQLREAPGGDMEGIFIAEGDVVIQRALVAGHRCIRSSSRRRERVLWSSISVLQRVYRNGLNLSCRRLRRIGAIAVQWQHSTAQSCVR